MKTVWNIQSGYLTLRFPDEMSGNCHGVTEGFFGFGGSVPIEKKKSMIGWTLRFGNLLGYFFLSIPCIRVGIKFQTTTINSLQFTRWKSLYKMRSKWTILSKRLGLGFSRLRKRAEEKRSGRPGRGSVVMIDDWDVETVESPLVKLEVHKDDSWGLNIVLLFLLSFFKTKWSDEKDQWYQQMEHFGVSFHHFFWWFIVWMVVFPCDMSPFSAWCLSKRRTIGTGVVTHVPSNRLKSSNLIPPSYSIGD